MNLGLRKLIISCMEPWLIEYRTYLRIFTQAQMMAEQQRREFQRQLTANMNHIYKDVVLLLGASLD